MNVRLHRARSGRQGLRAGLACCVVAIMFAMVTAASAAATRDALLMTKEEAKALLGKPGVVFLDGRISKAWNRSDRKIPGAVRADQWDLQSWVGDYAKDTTFIVY